MANKVTVTLEIDDKGNLKQVGQDANKAGKQVGNMTKNTQRAIPKKTKRTYVF